MDITTNFIAGRMNKSVDERLIPPGEYKNALNVRLGSTETTDIGAVENSKGNSKLTTILFNGDPLSSNATCIGAYADSVREQMYWFIHDNNPNGTTVDLIVSYNTSSEIVTYHVVSVSVLNFNPKYLITGVQLVEELLFFTDNINPPRVINITKSFSLPTGNIDGFVEEDISLIVKPPGFSALDLAAPLITLFKTEVNEENFLTDRFVSFAYRYRYENKQYSATSLFSLAAFDTLDFNIEPDSMINEGMENRANAAKIEYSTGTDKVKEIQLLYKESSSNVIYIIETFIKNDLGWNDNEIKTFIFTSNKVNGTLGSDELLRQYDNVPLLAQALTVQGNRVLLGNYIEGYDVETVNKQPIVIDFETNLSTQEVSTGVILAPFTIATTADINVPFCYTIAGSINNVPYQSCSDYNRIVFDLSTVPLPIEQGIVFNFNMQYYAYETTGEQGASLPANADYNIGDAQSPLSITLEYTAIRQFASASEMLNDVSFRTQVGEFVTPSSAIITSSNGGTLIDIFNRQILAEVENVTIANGYADDYSFFLESISSSTQNQILEYSGPIANRQGGTTLTNCFSLTFPAVRFDSVTGTAPLIFNYFRFILVDIQSGFPSPYSPLFSSYSLRPLVQTSGLIVGQEFNNKSLHSNRDYEVGIVYLDEYGRASTALVCPTNTLYIPTSNSITSNRIDVSVKNKPPFWAKKYKFVVKASRAEYDTVYCRRFYQDKSDTSIIWFALEGEDKALVKEGTQLVVKRDDTGPLDRLVVVTVLDVESYERGALLTNLSLPGLYMSIKPNNFSAQYNINDSINFGQNPALFGNSVTSSGGSGINDGPYTNYPIPQIYNPTTQTYDLAPIPQGAVIKISFRVWRTKWDPWLGSSDPSVDWRWEQTFVSPVAYDNFQEWWLGENISSYAEGTSNTGGQQLFMPPEFDINTNQTFVDGGEVQQDSVPGSVTSGIGPFGNTVGTQFGIKYTLYELPTAENEDLYKYYLQLRARVGAGGSSVDRRPSHVDMTIEFYGQDDLIIFETRPADADPNLFYDSSEMYNIAPDVNGILAHRGEIQNQVINTSTPAIVQLPHFNCFTFYNGAESYKIEGSATGKALALGQRTTAISTEPYAKQNRKASITYSGIYYPSSGINNSNEFNLGLANFKDLETNFGPVMKLHARQTDVLCLQEDRISYVLLGKNLISDSVGGGAIISVPEVLGQQIARIEEYGISLNPESFTSWGKNMFFSDTKRGAIIQLSGGSIKSDSLNIISDTGMRSYFRDKFITQLNTQKLGGYDPYMDEYVFSSNLKEIPIEKLGSPCGRTINVDGEQSFSAKIEIGALVGDVNVSYNVLNPPAATLDITIIFNGVTTSATAVSGAGVVRVSKTSVYPTTIDILVTPSERCSFTLLPRCISVKALTQVTQFVLTGGNVASNISFHYGYSWTDGVYTSPISENLAVNRGLADRTCLAGLGILEVQVDSGIASSGLIPYADTSIEIFVNKQGDTKRFNAARGNKLYAYTQKQLLSGCNEILADLTDKIPLTITTQNDRSFGTLTDLALTGSTITGTNSATAVFATIKDISVDFVALQISVGDTVTSSAGLQGSVSSVSSTVLGTQIAGVAATVVFQNEGYTIRRNNINQVVLVYDMRNKTGGVACEDIDPSTACNCIGVCTFNIMTFTPEGSFIDACLAWTGQIGSGSLVGRAHNSNSPIPIVGNIVYRNRLCDDADLLADGFYGISADPANNNSNEVIQVVNGICVDRQTIIC